MQSTPAKQEPVAPARTEAPVVAATEPAAPAKSKSADKKAAKAAKEAQAAAAAAAAPSAQKTEVGAIQLSINSACGVRLSDVFHLGRCLPDSQASSSTDCRRRRECTCCCCSMER